MQCTSLLNSIRVKLFLKMGMRGYRVKVCSVIMMRVFSVEEDKKKYNASSNLKNLYVQTNVTCNRIFDG